MIDIRFIRENPKDVKDNLKKRFMEGKVGLVDDITKLDKEWRDLKYKTDKLRAERNSVSNEINLAKKSKDEKKSKELMKKAKMLPDKIQKAEAKEKELEEKVKSKLSLIPNMLHPSVPVGRDETKNPEIRKWGVPKKPSFEIKNHADLVESLGLADFDAGRKNAGQGFNYLKGQLAELDLALQRYGIDFLLSKGFTLIVPPMMLNFKTLLGALNGLEDFEEVVYKVENEDLYLIGTAEHSLVSMLKGKTINLKDLPLKFCAVTPCFRKEIGSHGVDTKGLYRMHQFNKVEQVVFSNPRDSFKILEEMQKITEDFFKTLKIPYRVIEICSGDLGAKFAKQYDIESWSPRQQKYTEITSAGNCTDFQARALGIKFLDKTEREYVHVLNNTMVATSRAMVAILENNQNKDGSINIPTPLQKYMRGKKKIEVVKKK